MFLSKLFFTTCFIALLPVGLTKQSLDENELQSFFDITYKLVSSDKNFNEVLKVLGVSWTWRQVYTRTKPKIVLLYNPDVDEYTLSERGLMLKEDVNFQMDNQFWRNTIDGRPILDEFTVEGSTLREVQTRDEKPTLYIDRRFSADHINVTVKINDIVSYRLYDKVSSK